MVNLPFLKKKDTSPAVVDSVSYELQKQQTQALTTLAESTKAIASFLSSGGLTSLVSDYSKSQIAKSILGGLASHAGRDALDARTMGQNALEIVKVIEAVFDKAKEKQEALARGEQFDPEIKNAEAEFEQWRSRKEK